MIRFISLLGHLRSGDPRFAFFDTEVDRFLEFASEQAWTTKLDFLTAFAQARGVCGSRTYCLNRLTSLLPPWAEDPL